jgi:magnesium-protoporphyrin O-methyltransferase
MADCCSVNGLDRMFGRKTARREAAHYLKKGLAERIGKLVRRVPDERVRGAGVLDIGCGAGGAHLELLRRGAGSAVGVEVSAAYAEAARGLATELGHGEAVEYRLGDFVAIQDEIKRTDIVVLDRVVCCYPDMPALVAASAARAGRFYLLVAPREKWCLRGFARAVRFGMWLVRREFRFFVHSLEAIDRRLTEAGLKKEFETEGVLWRSTLLGRE